MMGLYPSTRVDASTTESTEQPTSQFKILALEITATGRLPTGSLLPAKIMERAIPAFPFVRHMIRKASDNSDFSRIAVYSRAAYSDHRFLPASYSFDILPI
jgi:hypothetical protein